MDTKALTAFKDDFADLGVTMTWDDDMIYLSDTNSATGRIDRNTTETNDLLLEAIADYKQWMRIRIVNLASKMGRAS